MRPHPLNPPHHNHDQSSSWEDNNYAYPRSRKPGGPAADLSMPDWPVRVTCPPHVRRGAPRRRPGWLGWGRAVGNLRLERVVANLGLVMTWWNDGHALISPGHANPAQVVCLVAGKLAVSPFAFFFSFFPRLSSSMWEAYARIFSGAWRNGANVQIIRIDRLSRLLVWTNKVFLFLLFHVWAATFFFCGSSGSFRGHLGKVFFWSWTHFYTFLWKS